MFAKCRLGGEVVIMSSKSDNPKQSHLFASSHFCKVKILYKGRTHSNFIFL